MSKKEAVTTFVGRKPPKADVGWISRGIHTQAAGGDYPHMPEVEHLVMCMADAAGIATVPHALIRQDDGIAYITKHVDRR